jgi:LuxR family transcriptional regulator, maltose regulon positive regulatory protein
MYVGMSQIACERDDLPAATRHLLRAEELGEHTWLPQNPYRWRVAMARVREAEGDLDGALDLLDEAQGVYTGDFSPNARPIPALRARVLAARGRLGEALAWARERGLSADDDLSYLRELEHITLARVLLAQRRAHRSKPAVHDAARLLRRLLQAAEAGERTGSVIEILVLQALTGHARGDVPGAVAALERALTLAEPEGYVRVFAGEGPPMASLLRRVAKQRTTRDYVRRLLSVGGTTPARQRLVEPYAKLGVNSRRAAVRQAAELDLLSCARDR